MAAHAMSIAVLFGLFILLMLAGVPIGVALGAGGVVAIVMSNLDSQLWGLLAAPQNLYASLTKYPLLALPMFVLVGSIFDRSGVALRLVNFAVAIVGRGPGMLPLVAISVAMLLGGISGSGPANAAAVGGVMVAAVYGLFVGMVVHRTIGLRDLYPIFREAAELSGIILLVIGLASIFAYAVSTLGVADPFTRAIVNSGMGEYGVLSALIVLLIVVGMFLDGVSIFLIFVPLLMPVAQIYHWDPVWFGVLLTLKIAVGQFTPPMAVNLMVSCRIAGVRMEQTLPWVGWLIFAMMLVLVAVVAVPDLALWLPRQLGL